MAESRSPSPASTLDFADSSGSEAEYVPAKRARKAPAGGKKKAAVAKINLSALQRAQSVAAAHPADGDVEEEPEYDDEEGGPMDLSSLDLKPDHAARPLWVDDSGHMYVGSPRCVMAPPLTKKYPRGIRGVCAAGAGIPYCHCRASLEVRPATPGHMTDPDHHSSMNTASPSRPSTRPCRSVSRQTTLLRCSRG